MNKYVECPECAALVQPDADVEVGELITCPECGTELEVTAIDPLQVTLAPQVEEDWGE